MTMAQVTVNELLTYMHSSSDSTLLEVAATPSTTALALLQTVLDAAILSIEIDYVLPETYPANIKLAILAHAAYLWEQRNSPNGIILSDVGIARAGKTLNHVEILLAPYKRIRFGAS